MKILVVDDSRTARSLIRTILAPMENYEVDEAPDGEIALKKLNYDAGYKIILLDYKMPNMNGLQTLYEIRKIKAYRNTPVIIITSDGGKDIVIKFIQSGANDYIVKPIIADILIEKIEKCFESHE